MKEHPPMSTHEEAAQQEIERIDLAIDEWRVQLATKRQEIATAQANAAHQVLAGTTTTAKVAQHQASLRDEVVTIEDVIEALQQQRIAAQRARLEAKIVDARAQQQALRDELAVHDQETARLMALLRAHEGPNARLCGETQSLYLLERITNFDHSISGFEYRLRQFDEQHATVAVPVADMQPVAR